MFDMYCCALLCQPPTHERQANLHQNFCQTLGRYSGSEVAEAVQFLISFIQQPSVAIGEREIGLLAKALWASKIPYQHMFIAGAQEFAIPEEAMRVWEFPVQFFPGPPTSPHRWYICGHGTTPGGFLTAGRVFRSDADVVGAPPDQDCFNFYGKAMQWTNWVPGPTADSRRYPWLQPHQIKIRCNHPRVPFVQVPLSSGKTWAIREAGARVDRIWVLSSSRWAGSSSRARSFLTAPPMLAITNDDDWGSSWPSPKL